MINDDAITFYVYNDDAITFYVYNDDARTQQAGERGVYNSKLKTLLKIGCSNTPYAGC